MKKAHLLFALVTAAVAGNCTNLCQNSSALYKDDQTTWWTVEEMLDFKQNADTEMEELCGRNFGCREELRFERLNDYNNQYFALERLEESQFNITSINPEQEIMKVLYFDQNHMMRRMGEEEHDPLKHIFIGWFDEIKNPGEIGNYYYKTPLEKTFSVVPHIVYQQNAEDYPGGAFPVNQEFTLPISGSNIKNNSLGKVGVAVFADQFNAMGYTDYSACFTAPDYTPGTECRLMVSSGGELRFMPPRETVTILANEEAVNSVVDDTANGTSSSPSVHSPTDLAEEPNASTATPNNTDTEPKSATIKAPNTGTYTREQEFLPLPWWFITIILVNILTLAWLFWPLRQKSSKNSKKPIDKVKILR